jgi:hypothetical protein
VATTLMMFALLVTAPPADESGCIDRVEKR